MACRVTWQAASPAARPPHAGGQTTPMPHEGIVQKFSHSTVQILS